ncbi:histidine kinase [Phenylobacterium sp. Root77]|uniref:hybrid sensor histidine kinase/response regulator n=1 Tax=unclassified Phenylobacterium TaxID=2640670 RepID=UPI0006F51C68|nr:MULTISPECIES: ATP-binding protein [unclassified Phenylobacterium]KQW66503.1 histidine kinase [Phenylobacterium sp. Root1277]KQW89009.1 histidine kinase [Phenylobacterium sp. Root1290]KRC42135.1 histidine kinase [Phenylobacterium sp. Root77]
MLVETDKLKTRGGSSVTQQALETQTSLLPYALGVFTISLPILVWAGSYAQNAVWMTGTFAIFAVAWGVFYAAVNWLKEPEALNLRKRGQVHILCGLIWAAAVAQLAAFGDGAGPVRGELMLISVAAAVMVIFFTAPWLPSLLIVGAATAAGPLYFLLRNAEERSLANLAWGGIALAFALALILNRILRRQFALAAEREVLITDRDLRMDQARQLAQSKSDLVATLSHEIRNGLTGVAHVLASAVGHNGRSAPSREQLSAALDAANDLISVLNTTLDSETAEAGRLEVDTHAFDAVALIRDLVILNRPNAASRGLELTLHIAPDLASRERGAAVADAHRARQILANLLGNALKFTVRGRVEARVELAASGRLAVEIADTGPGLAHEELEQAFEPFNRIARTSAGTSGAGLGLSLSRQLARLMGGELSAHSAVGVGSCFRLELPFDVEAQPTGEIETPVELGAVQTETRQRLRVLIAEDDALNAAMLRAVLEQLGHQVVHAVDGRRAVDLARVCEFDLLMIDGRMPNMDGPAAIAAVRELEGAIALVPIVAVIGGDADEANECTQAGADSVLRKPVSVSAVARAVADAVAVERGETPARAFA